MYKLLTVAAVSGCASQTCTQDRTRFIRLGHRRLELAALAGSGGSHANSIDRALFALVSEIRARRKAQRLIPIIQKRSPARAGLREGEVWRESAFIHLN